MSWNGRSKRRVRRAGADAGESPVGSGASAAVGPESGITSGDGGRFAPAAAGPSGLRHRDDSGTEARRATGPTERAAHRLYAEVVWSTVDRLPLVAPGARVSIEAQLIALCRRLDVEPVAVRVSAARVRLVLRFKPAHSIGVVVTSLKLGSQDAAVLAGRPVRWAPGFAALSLSVTEVRRRALRLRARG